MWQAVDHTPSYYCYLGAVGWEHPEWATSFYPQDMPEEWRFAYYASQFSCIYLAHHHLSRCTPAALAALAEDASDGFRFVLELPDAAARDTKKAALFGNKLGLVVARGKPCSSLLWFTGKTDLKALAQDIDRRLKEQVPLYLISEDHDLGSMERVRALLEVMGL
jgi:uncharacterized protein YecE (DUF72 family)